MLVRDLIIADVAALREIDRLAFKDGEQYSAAFYDEVIFSDAFLAIGAQGEDGSIVGWALIDLGRTPIRIRSLSVHPSFHRRGIATALVNYVSRRGYTLDLLVEPANAAAIALYEKLGFVTGEPDPELPERVRMVRVPRAER